MDVLVETQEIATPSFRLKRNSQMMAAWALNSSLSAFQQMIVPGLLSHSQTHGLTTTFQFPHL